MPIPTIKRATIGALLMVVALVILVGLSLFFGLTGEICEQGSSRYYSECTRHNLILVILWKALKLLDDGSVLITALATIAIAWFTLTLRQSSDRLAGISESQTKITQAQLLSEHRPRLRVRHVALVDDDGRQLSKLPGIDDRISGGLAVVNSGGTKATVVDSRYLIYFAPSKDGLPMMSPLDERGDALLHPGTGFNIGESIATPITGTVSTDMPPGTFLVLGPIDWTVFVMGQIRYRDEGGNDRFMGFCRQWSGDGTFRAVTDPDYEYED